MVDAYIGDLNSTGFDWENGNYSGNIPKRITPFFPGGRDAFRAVINLTKKEEIDGKQTDWGAFVIRAYPEEILGMVKEIYSDQKDINTIESYIKELDPEQRYGLVAMESY